MNLSVGVAALVVAGTFAYGRFSATEEAAKAKARAAIPLLLSDWPSDVPYGTALTESQGPITIVEFSDFQCPFCRQFDETVKRVERKHPGKMRRMFVHFPLTRIHPHAMAAAKAVECAAEQGRFAQMHGALFAKQDSIGTISWTSFATQAGVADTAKLKGCLARAEQPKKLTEGIAAANRLAVTGTPTVIINGWRLPYPPNDSVLDATVVTLLAGRSLSTK